MPFLVVPVVALAVTAFTTGLTVAAVVGAVVSIGLSFVSQALTRRPSLRQSPTSMPVAQPHNGPTVDNKVTIRQPAAARTIVYGRTRVSGVYGFVHTTNNNKDLHIVLLMAGHQIEGYDEIWLNDERVTIDSNGMVTDGSFANQVFITRYNGWPTQVADPFLVEVTGGLWNSFCRLQGIAYLIVHLLWDAEVFQSGVPNVTAVIRGKNNIYDPRTGTFGYTNNAALCLADYLHDPLYGVPVEYGTGIDLAALSAAANACDEFVPTIKGPERRFAADGILMSSARLDENIGLLLSAMHGTATYDGEAWTINAGVYQAPTEFFSDDDLRGGPKVQTMVSRRDLFNGVKGTFIGPDNSWQKADFPPHASASYVAEDGQELWRDIELVLTSSAARAQRLAKIELQKIRQPIVATMPCKLTAWKAKAGDTVAWTSPRYGWVNKPFEVRRAQFAVDRDTMTLGVDLELVETDPSVYDWFSSEEASFDPAPNTFFPQARTCLPPSNLQVTESLYATREGGGVKALVRLDWDASQDAFVAGYLPFYRAVGGTVWTPLGRTAALFAEWPDALPGTYDFAVAAINYRDVVSALVVARKAIIGLSAKPAAPSNLTVIAGGNVMAMASLDLSPDLDVRQGGTLHFRHSTLASGAAWSQGTTISRPLPGNTTLASLPLKAGTYMSRFRDSSGNWSDMASFVQAQNSVLQFTSLGGGLLEEDPTFPGGKSAGTLTRTVDGDSYAGLKVPYPSPGGHTFKWSVWLKAGTQTGDVRLHLRDGSDGEHGAQTFGITSSWQLFSIEAMFSGGAANDIRAYVNPVSSLGGAGATLHVFDPHLTEGGVEKLVTTNFSDATFGELVRLSWTPKALQGPFENTTVDAGNLKLADNGFFDDVPDVDALVSWDFSEGVAAAGSYPWSTPIDLGLAKRFRLTVTIGSQVVDVFDDFDSREAPVDTWPSWDGVIDGSEADAVTFVRTTFDDPGGTPTWTAWQRCDAAEIEARAIELRTDLTSTDSSFNIHVSELSALAEEVV